MHRTTQHCLMNFSVMISIPRERWKSRIKLQFNFYKMYNTYISFRQSCIESSSSVAFSASCEFCVSFCR